MGSIILRCASYNYPRKQSSTVIQEVPLLTLGKYDTFNFALATELELN